MIRSRIKPLGEALRTLADLLDKHGEDIFDKTASWELGPAQGDKHDERGGGLGDAGHERADNAREDRRAARMHAQWLEALTMIDEGQQAARMIGAQVPVENKRRHDAQLLGSLAAEGWCTSCWRDDQHLAPIETRKNGQPYYRDTCRFCGEWKAEHGQYPPLAILVLHHKPGGRISQQQADRLAKRAG